MAFSNLRWESGLSKHKPKLGDYEWYVTGTKSDRHDLRSHPIQILILVYMRPVRKISSDRSHSFRVLNRHEWVQRFELGSVRNFVHDDAKSLQINHWWGKEQEKYCCWEQKLGIWTEMLARTSVSFRSYVNTSENFHFGSGPNSYRPHVISPLVIQLKDSISSALSHMTSLSLKHVYTRLFCYQLTLWRQVWG